MGRKKKENIYQDEYKVSPLKVVTIIVNRNQGEYFVNHIKNGNLSSMCLLLNGSGTASQEIYDLLGIGETKKDVVISIVKEENIPLVKALIEKRFNISKASKGVAFINKVDSIIGVLAYRFLSDTKINVKRGE